MSAGIALTHRTTCSYDRPINLAPQVVGWRPAPHSRTPINSPSLKIEPEDHVLNWKQDAYANWSARLVFPKPTRQFSVTVDLVADMIAINPFDFCLADTAEQVRFDCAPARKKDLRPSLRKLSRSQGFKDVIDSAPVQQGETNNGLVALNGHVAGRIDDTIRVETGVQSPAVAIQKALGWCRDSAWLMVAVLRAFGNAARFVSGDLNLLTTDQKPIEGPAGPEDSSPPARLVLRLPAGCGLGGMDPTSGLFAGEGHIPLATTPGPSTAAACASRTASIRRSVATRSSRARPPGAPPRSIWVLLIRG